MSRESLFQLMEKSYVDDFVNNDSDIPHEVELSAYYNAINMWIHDSKHSTSQTPEVDMLDQFFYDVVTLKLDENIDFIDQQVKWQPYIDKFPKDMIVQSFVGYFYNMIGERYAQMSEFEVGIQFLSTALRSFAVAKNRHPRSRIHSQIGSYYQQLGMTSIASYHEREARSINKVW